jgi:hypothetical protein
LRLDGASSKRRIRGSLILSELSIPKTDRAGLAILRELQEAAFNALLAEIERSPGSVPTVPGLSPNDAERAVDALNTMYTIRAFSEVSTDGFISDVCAALREYNELTPIDEPVFRERLGRLLDIEALSIAAKAASLQSEYEHLFCSARVLTDARPVYGKDPQAPPAAMIITHALKISYHEATGRLKEFYVGLGSSDITEFQEVLKRAEDKAISLRAVFDAKVKFIDPQE